MVRPALRVIVAGATAWSDAAAVRGELARLPAGSTVVHGDAPGADALAGRVAAELGLPVEPFRKEAIDYRRYRRGAWKGLNERMLAAGADLVLAFHPALDRSRGTKHLVGLARAAGVPVRLVAGPSPSADSAESPPREPTSPGGHSRLDELGPTR